MVDVVHTVEGECTKQVVKAIFYVNHFILLYSGTDTQGSQEFIPNFSLACRQFDMVQISNACACVH